MILPHGPRQRAVYQIGAGGDDQESGFEQDGQLQFGDPVQQRELQVAFPRFKNDFDAPPQAVDRQDVLEAGRCRRDGGDENGPVHEGQDRRGGLMAFGFFFGLPASEIGGFHVHRGGHEADGGTRWIVEPHHQVKGTLLFEQRRQIDGLGGLGIKVNRSGPMPVNAIGPGRPVSLEFIQDQIAAIAQGEVARLEG